MSSTTKKDVLCQLTRIRQDILNKKLTKNELFAISSRLHSYWYYFEDCEED